MKALSTLFALIALALAGCDKPPAECHPQGVIDGGVLPACDRPLPEKPQLFSDKTGSYLLAEGHIYSGAKLYFRHPLESAYYLAGTIVGVNHGWESPGKAERRWVVIITPGQRDEWLALGDVLNGWYYVRQDDPALANPRLVEVAPPR